jgi:quinol monooxygenase YgiN
MTTGDQLATSGVFVVIAEFDVQPGKRDQFLEAASDDVGRSAADEPGCRQFDVIRPESGNTVMSDEVYDSRAPLRRTP